MFVQYVVTRLGVLLACRKKPIDNFSNAVPVRHDPFLKAYLARYVACFSSLGITPMVLAKGNQLK